MSDIVMINLLNTIKKISAPPKRNNLVFGKVVKIDPLEIDIGDNIVLSGKFL